LLSTAVAAVAAAVVPVHAAQSPADAGRIAVANLTFHLSHNKTLNLELRAAALSGGNSLRVIAHRCSNGKCDADPHAYQSSLSATSLTIDQSNAVAELTTTLAGHALRVRWQPDGANAAAVGGFESTGDDLSDSGSDYEGSPAKTAIELDGTSCAGEGAVGTGAFADTGAATGSPDYAPLSDVHVPAAAPLTCGLRP